MWTFNPVIMNSPFLNVCSNPISRNVTPGYWKVVHGGGGRVEAAIVLLIIVISLPWNILVIFTILKQKLYQQPSVLLLFNLAVADILLTLITLPSYAAIGMTSEYFNLGRSDWVKCHFCYVEVLPIIQIYNSYFSVGVMSVDRLIFIVKPLKYHYIVTSCRLVAIVMAILLLSVAVALVMLGIPARRVFFEELMSCWIPFEAANYPYFIIPLSISLGNLIVIIFCNVWIAVLAQRNIKAIYRYSKCDENNGSSKISEFKKRIESSRFKKQLHLFQVFGAILLVNLLCWLPFIIISFLQLSFRASFTEDFNRAAPAAMVFLFSTVLFHPIVETLLLKDVREPFLKLITCANCTNANLPEDPFTSSSRPSNHDQNTRYKCSFIWTVIMAGLLPQSSESQVQENKEQT